MAWAPVWRRVKALETAGVIQGYSAQVDRTKVGLGGCMFAQISLERHSANTVENFERSVRDAPEILECYAVTGESDYILKIVAADLSELADSVLKALTHLPGVASIRSNIVLNCVKSTTELPLDHLGRQNRRKRQARYLER